MAQAWTATEGKIAGFDRLEPGHHTMHVRAAGSLHAARMAFLVKGSGSPGKRSKCR